ncbi:SH3 domain-containing protein [uncultured Erythrobacter sp.]|uniref:SH3 domain-containing protein n=1 Tax=uncultured Erythrobacter sp. TaxID=263913 RepID=UPI002625A9D2|nr:SH3 domain-containing protein [uncultured Erythrobacter sp.]
MKFAAELGYHGSMKALRFLAIFAFTIGFSVVSWPEAIQAQDREVPYWATLRFDQVNMRKGPSQDYPIDWVYKRKGLPVRVVRLREGWRLVQDPEGTQGWIASSQLSPNLGALIIGDGLAELRAEPAASSLVRWKAEPGVVGDLLGCRQNYCEIDVGGRTGWVLAERVWGSGEM